MKPRVLLLGGTGEALQLAHGLAASHIYSLAGLGEIPQDLQCQVRVGGFGGVSGLADFIAAQGITLVIDATHPYASAISANAVAACALQKCPLWQWRRPGWTAAAGDDWRFLPDWAAIQSALAVFAHAHTPAQPLRVLLTLGRSALPWIAQIAPNQHWIVRCLPSAIAAANLTGVTVPRATIVAARGPFTEPGEQAFFEAHGVAVLVSKHSGGAATAAKLQIARQRQIPVLLLERPANPDAGDAALRRTFDDVHVLRAALSYIATSGGTDAEDV